MIRIGKVSLAVLFVFLIVQVVIFAPMSVEEGEKEPQLQEMESNNIQQAMKGIHLIETREGEKEWELWSETALSFKGSENWDLENVKAVFFGSNGVYFTVTGKSGRVDTKTKNMMVKGGVVTKSSNGYLFQTEQVNYDSKERGLVSPNQVEMIGPRDEDGNAMQLKGHGMKANLLDSTMEILSEVRAEKIFDQKKRVVIRSQSSYFSGKSRMAKFLGNVIMDIDTIRITGPEANFQYDAESEMVKSVMIQGGVRVSDLDKWATSQNVSVHFDEDKYVFQGSPRLVQNNDELRGEKIIFLDGGRRVQIQKARARVDEKRMENAK